MPLELFNSSAPLLCGGDLGCSGHGSCEGGVCYCDAMYNGAACERLEGILTRACPSDCSAHGTSSPKSSTFYPKPETLILDPRP
jgi:hypothetical protein